MDTTLFRNGRRNHQDIDWVALAQKDQDFEFRDTTFDDIKDNATFAASKAERREFEAKAKTPEQPQKKRFYSMQDCQEIAPLVWLVQDLIPANSDIAIYGESGGLKTFIALDLALSIRLGLHALGCLPVRNTGAEGWPVIGLIVVVISFVAFIVWFLNDKYCPQEGASDFRWWLMWAWSMFGCRAT